MEKVPESITENKLAKELSCSKRQIQEHGFSTEALEVLIQPLQKKRKVNSFQIKHNVLAKVIMFIKINTPYTR
jgi:hypothetical protein